MGANNIPSEEHETIIDAQRACYLSIFSTKRNTKLTLMHSPSPWDQSWGSWNPSRISCPYRTQRQRHPFQSWSYQCIQHFQWQFSAAQGLSMQNIKLMLSLSKNNQQEEHNLTFLVAQNVGSESTLISHIASCKGRENSMLRVIPAQEIILDQ